MRGKNTFMKWNFIIPLTLILVSVINSNAVLDTTKIGIEEGDIYHYKVVAFTDTIDNETELCVTCPDTGPVFMVSEGDEYDMEILSITGNSVNVNYSKGSESLTEYHRLDKRTESNILYTDWDYWPGSIAEDWAWWVEAEANQTEQWGDTEGFENFELTIIHQVENDVFNTYLERHWTYNVNEVDGWKSYTWIQHIEYELDTGVISLLKFNTTIAFWDNTTKVSYEETVLEHPEIIASSDLNTSSTSITSSESSRSSDSNIKLGWLFVPFTVFAIQRRKQR